MCFSRRRFQAGICKRPGMLLKFDTTLCSPVLELLSHKRIALTQMWWVLSDTQHCKTFSGRGLSRPSGVGALTGLVSVGVAWPFKWFWDDGCSQWQLSSQCFFVTVYSWYMQLIMISFMINFYYDTPVSNGFWCYGVFLLFPWSSEAVIHDAIFIVVTG